MAPTATLTRDAFMYRIEVAPGEETVFRTIEELAVGIRNGVITPRSRIYHNASQKWLPIGLHPHYKKAMELPAASGAHPAPSAPVPVAPRTPHIKVTDEHRASAPKGAAARVPTSPSIPAPVVSPIVAMQREVLRDLPVIAIPEPLPWTAPPVPEVGAASARAAVQALPTTPVVPPVVRSPKPIAASVPPVPIARIAQTLQARPSARVTYEPLALSDPQHAEPEAESHARPTARRSVRGSGRPLLLLGAATAVVLAASYALSSAPSASANVTSSAEPVSSPAPAAPSVERTGAPAEETIADPPPRVTSAPARVPMTPGPAFAGSAPVRPGADTAPLRTPTVAAPRVAPAAAAAPSLAPAPVELDLSLPDLRTDSLAPSTRRDTAAMKKILRALNGAKPPETPAATP